MNRVTETQTFNNPALIVEGWYWALRSDELRRGKVKPVSFLGRELALYRGEDGRVRALDAHCPHMGAHFAEGRVEGNDLRCLFHYWKFDESGRCNDIPCQKQVPESARVGAWPVDEKYGLIWIWTGGKPTRGIPEVPELEGLETVSKLGNEFVKDCHPNVMMINAIDAQHFNSVHNLPVALNLEPEVVSGSCIRFANTTRMPGESALTRFFGRFYSGALTYALCYWFGSTGSVTVGPDFQHFHIIFALRPTSDGKSEGQTILVTRKRTGFTGAAYARVLLFLTAVVGNYFAKGDTLIFKTIKFNLSSPIRADFSIIRFIQHVEQQGTLPWGFPSLETNA